MQKLEFGTDTIAAILFAFLIVLVLSSAALTSSIYRGNTIRALCNDLAINGVYSGECLQWRDVRDLHRNLQSQAERVE